MATEVNKLSYKEKVKIIELVSEHSKQRIPTAVTIQGNSIEEYIKLIYVAKSNNANWVILQPLLKENTTDKDCYIFFNKLIPYVGNTLVGIQNAKEYLGAGVISKDVIKLYKKFPNFRVMKAESSSIFMGEEIKQYPKDLRVFNGRGGQEIVDNFILGCKGIVPALENADTFLKIYQYTKLKNYNKVHEEYMKILPSIVFVMQSISTLICYGKRICAYRMGAKKMFDRKPCLLTTNYGLKKSKKIARELGSF